MVTHAMIASQSDCRYYDVRKARNADIRNADIDPPGIRDCLVFIEHSNIIGHNFGNRMFLPFHRDVDSSIVWIPHVIKYFLFKLDW